MAGDSRITAIIKPVKLDDVCEAVIEVGIQGINRYRSQIFFARLHRNFAILVSFR